VLGAACGNDDPADASPTTSPAPTTATAPLPEAAGVDGSGFEYGYETDLTSIEAGLVEVRFTNTGAEDHQAMLVRFDDGADLGALVAAGAADPTGIQALDPLDGYGGPNGAGPGDTVASRQVLEPGEYRLTCFIPASDGQLHASKGMVRPFTVAAPASGAAAELEPGDVHLGTVDFGFETPDELPEGATAVVTNDGGQGHELYMCRFEGDATAEDAATEDAPGAPAAGLGILRPGGTATFRIPDEPGRYALLCFLLDVTSDGTPHVARGMVAEVNVS
jgi:plastocyanin